jgi:hypothetical protein
MTSIVVGDSTLESVTSVNASSESFFYYKTYFLSKPNSHYLNNSERLRKLLCKIK